MFEYGIIIGDKHTGRDWGLVCTQVEIESPEQKTQYVEVPGRDGYLDLSEVLTGEPHYKNRNLKISLIRREQDFRRWHVKASDVTDYCHNIRRKVIFDSDPGYYFDGRLKAESSKNFKGIDCFTISVDAQPYKYERFSSLEPWIWDIFSFEDGIIRNYKDLRVDGELTLMILGRRMKAVPVFECSSELNLTYRGKTYTLPAGRSKMLDLRIGEGEHFLTFTGSGTVSVDYRGGRL